MSFSSMNYIRNFRNLVQKINLSLGNHNSSPVFSTNFKPFLKSYTPSIVILAEKKTIAEELGLPEPPKKPLSGFFLYVADESKNLGHMKLTEKISKLAANWRAMDESKKLKYVNEYNMEFESYMQKLKDYNKRLSLEQLEDIKILKVKKRKEREAAVKKRLDKNTEIKANKPKHPGNAFSLFVESINKQGIVPKDSKLMLFARDKWQALSQIEKESYTEEAKKQQLRYKEELGQWEKKMLAEGRHDLVRKSTLTAIKKEK